MKKYYVSGSMQVECKVKSKWLKMILKMNPREKKIMFQDPCDLNAKSNQNVLKNR